MKSNAKLQAIVEAARKFWPDDSNYPESVVDLVIYHKLHFYLPPAAAAKAFRALTAEFVDWNEVRVSVVREVQEHLAEASNSLELSVFVKDFLEFVHKESRRVHLEPLVEENLTDIRKFFKKAKAVDPVTVDLVLLRRKSHPVVPLSPEMEQVLVDLGLCDEADSRDRKSKALHDAVEAENATAVHHYLLHAVHASRNQAGESWEGLPDELSSGRGKAKARSSATKKSATKSAKSSRTKTSTKKKSTTAKK